MKVFICYRREDAQHQAGRLYDRLELAFGAENVFKDVDSIPIGADFRVELSEAIANCDVVLVLIGDQWIDSKYSGGGRRLDDPNDFVRVEVESALAKGVSVVPVLVASSPLPAPGELPEAMRDLVFRHGVSLRPDPFFRSDVSQLIANLESSIHRKSARQTETWSTSHQEDDRVAPHETTEPETDAAESGPLDIVDAEIDELDESVLDDSPSVDDEDDLEASNGADDNRFYRAMIVHEHQSTGFLADLFVSDQVAAETETIVVEFTHPLLERSRCRVEVRLPSNTEPLQYLRLPNLIRGYPIVLRIHWLLHPAFHCSVARETPPVVSISSDSSQTRAEDSVGVIVGGEFKTIIPSDVTLPHIAHKKFRTSRDSQRGLSILPAVRRTDRSVQAYDKLKVLVPPAYAGVAWMEFRFRIDTDGRLTVTAHDPTKEYKVVAAWIVG